MTYTAWSSDGPRIAVARSTNLFDWERLGLAHFGLYGDIAADGVDDKDACLFPVAIQNPSGQPELAILHRPLFPGTRPEEIASRTDPHEVDLDTESIWISYSPPAPGGGDAHQLGEFTSHHRLAAPVSPWERLKIGGGTPPLLTRFGWLIIYHGVSDSTRPTDPGCHLRYAAGAMILSSEHPQHVLYRSAHPVLEPTLPQERVGTVADVIFPTGIDRRDDLGVPERFDVYYGMADDRIGVARLDLPDHLGRGASADTASDAR
jgi:predicted GH43/DUF377 family glycosyl hydrolase